jgi:hypothetical protein
MCCGACGRKHHNTYGIVGPAISTLKTFNSLGFVLKSLFMYIRPSGSNVATAYQQFDP